MLKALNWILKTLGIVFFLLCIFVGITIWSFSPSAACLFKSTASEQEIVDAALIYNSLKAQENNTDIVINFGSENYDPLLSSSYFIIAVFYPTGSEEAWNEYEYKTLGFSRCGKFIGSYGESFSKDSRTHLFYRGLINRKEHFKNNPKVAANSEYIDFFIGERHLRIPKAYVHNNQYITSSEGLGYISIRATAPEFNDPNIFLNLSSSVQFGSRDWINGLGKDIINAKPTGTLNDLIEVLNEENGVDWYYNLNSKNEIRTIIGCYDGREKETACQHRFYREGAMYSFDHSRSLLAISSNMEVRLYQLIKSFEVNRETGIENR